MPQHNHFPTANAQSDIAALSRRHTLAGQPQLVHPAFNAIEVNVGGEIFTTSRNTLCRVPGSFLAKLFSGRSQATLDHEGRIFIDRSPTQFRAILEALREPAAISLLDLSCPVTCRELEFYGLLQTFATPQLGGPPALMASPHASASRSSTPLAAPASASVNKALVDPAQLDSTHPRHTTESTSAASEPGSPTLSRPLALEQQPALAAPPAKTISPLAMGEDEPPGTPSLLAVGGLNEGVPYKYLRVAERYDAATDTWHRISDMFWDRALSGVASTGSNLYVLGGRNDNLDGIVGNFNAPSGQWQEARDMTLPDALYGAGYAILFQQLVVAGGCRQRPRAGRPEVVTATVMSYPLEADGRLGATDTPQRRQWLALPSLGTPRGRHGCVADQGHIFVLGGVDVQGHPIASVERFSPTRNQWEVAAPMPAPRRDFGCVALEGYIYVVGGADGPVGTSRKLTSCVASVFVYDMRANTWSTGPSLPEPRQGLACAVLENHLYAVGGSRDDDVFSSKPAKRMRRVDKLRLGADRWTSAAPLTFARSHLGMGMVSAVWNRDATTITKTPTRVKKPSRPRRTSALASH